MNFPRMIWPTEMGECQRSSSVPIFFSSAKSAHGQERQHEEEDDAHVVEKRPEDHLVDVDLLGVILDSGPSAWTGR